MKVTVEFDDLREEIQVELVRAIKDSEMLDFIVKEQQSLPFSVFKAIEENTNTSEKTIEQLEKSNYCQVRRLVTEGDVDEATLQKIAQKLEDPILLDAIAQRAVSNTTFYIVASNKNTASQTLEKLARVWSESVRKKVAKHPNTSVTTLKMLSKDIDPEVRACVVENTNTSEEILFELTNDPSDCVRCLVAENASTARTVDKLASDKDMYVRWNAAESDAVSVDVLVKLAECDCEEEVRLAALENRNLPIDTLRRLAETKNVRVRETIAENPHTPEDVLNQLAKTNNSYTRSLIIKNPNVSRETLEYLVKVSKKKDEEIFWRASSALKNKK